MAIPDTIPRKWVMFAAVMFGVGGVTYLVLQPMMETPEKAVVGALAFLVLGLIVMWYHVHGPTRWWSWQAWKHARRDARGEDTGENR